MAIEVRFPRFTARLDDDGRWTVLSVEGDRDDIRPLIEESLNLEFGPGWTPAPLTYEPDPLYAQARAAAEDRGGTITDAPEPPDLPPDAKA